MIVIAVVMQDTSLFQILSCLSNTVEQLTFPFVSLCMTECTVTTISFNLIAVMGIKDELAYCVLFKLNYWCLFNYISLDQIYCS